ncbi:MAG: alanine--glyoxylate aminotransferase family protein [Anaerolineales bacterium]|nr:alanine--glyoxylate aminotransferase family protein [Anaerolineales bacterium]
MNKKPVLPDHKLMIPGPVELEDDILAESGRQIAAHYGPEWTELHQANLKLLHYLFQTEGDTTMLFSSGSGGVEAAMATILGAGEKVIILRNGFFGDRWAEMARARGLEPIEVVAPMGTPVDPAEVQKALETQGPIGAIVAVHHETSTGILNPIKELGALARQYGVPFIVDAIASLGGDPLYMDDWQIDICIAASNKCLGVAPGLALVGINPAMWELAEKKQIKAAGWYLNLNTWRFYQENVPAHPTPVTMHSRIMSSLNLALEKLQERGLEEQWRIYKTAASYFRGGMAELGFTMFAPQEHASSVISAVNVVPGMDAEDFIAYLQKEHQIRISSAMGELHGKAFRVGHLGKAGSAEYINAFLEATQQYLSAG